MEKDPESSQKSQSQFPLLGVPQTNQVNNYRIYAENLLQTHAGSGIAASVSLKPYDLCLVDSMGQVLLCPQPLSLLQFFLSLFLSVL